MPHSLKMFVSNSGWMFYLQIAHLIFLELSWEKWHRTMQLHQESIQANKNIFSIIWTELVVRKSELLPAKNKCLAKWMFCYIGFHVPIILQLCFHLFTMDSANSFLAAKKLAVLEEIIFLLVAFFFPFRPSRAALCMCAYIGGSLKPFELH